MKHYTINCCFIALLIFVNCTDNTHESTISTSPENMVFIKGGQFQMGSEDIPQEQPVHEVRLNDFYIGKYEVTVKEYLAFCEATKSNYPQWMKPKDIFNPKATAENYYKNSSYKPLDNMDLPIVGISWSNAVAYCKWLSKQTGQHYRLPTEAEWEYAAKGGINSKGFKYAGSDSINEVAWNEGNAASKVHRIGKLKPNELGIYDMSGNVWEWCEDNWHDNYKNAPTDGSAWLHNEDYSRVIRGGSWQYYKMSCSTTYRDKVHQTKSGLSIGFRIVRSD